MDNPWFHVDNALAKHLPSEKTEACMTAILRECQTGQEMMLELDKTISELVQVRKSLYKCINGTQSKEAFDIIEI